MMTHGIVRSLALLLTGLLAISTAWSASPEPGEPRRRHLPGRQPFPST